ncbi:hypothetical protein Plhal304r1_c003g0011361 [Plasmopara halstedii]
MGFCNPEPHVLQLRQRQRIRIAARQPIHYYRHLDHARCAPTIAAANLRIKRAIVWRKCLCCAWQIGLWSFSVKSSRSLDRLKAFNFDLLASRRILSKEYKTSFFSSDNALGFMYESPAAICEGQKRPNSAVWNFILRIQDIV